MKTGRLLSLVRSMLQRAIEEKDTDGIARMMAALLNLEHDRRVELEKELASLKLNAKYGRRKGDK